MRAAAGAERDAHRDFLLASDRARQQQVGDVRAGDEQHEGDGAEQHQQAPAGRSARADPARGSRATRTSVFESGCSASSWRAMRVHLDARLVDATRRRLQPRDRKDARVPAAILGQRRGPRAERHDRCPPAGTARSAPAARRRRCTAGCRAASTVRAAALRRSAAAANAGARAARRLRRRAGRPRR